MRQKHNTLLAGVAALALLAGGGIAAAQQSPQGQNSGTATGMSGQSGGTAQPSKQSGGTGMDQHAQTASPTGGVAAQGAKANEPSNEPSMARQSSEAGKAESRSAETKQSTDQKANRSARNDRQRLGQNPKTATAKNATAKNVTAKNTAKANGEAKQRLGENAKSKTESRQRSRLSERNQHNGKLKGLQGNASIPMQGSHVKLTSNQRTRVRDTVIDARGAPRIGHVDFHVTVGSVVPRDRIHVVPVPETLVRIDPQWHGYLYFIVEDQVVIVNPRDMRIVAVLDV